MRWSVVLDAGRFDLPLYEFYTRDAAEIYSLQVRSLTDQDIKIKDSDEVRHLQEIFVRDDILVDLQ